MTDPTTTKKKRHWGKIIAIFFIVVLSVVGFFVYNNFNRLLSEALMDAFNSHIVSDVYELKFEKLRVNIFDGDVTVANVVMQPREVPARNYPYINSSFRLTAERLSLLNLQIFEFLKTKRLNLESIAIERPDFQVKVGGKKQVLFPFKDSVANPHPRPPGAATPSPRGEGAGGEGTVPGEQKGEKKKTIDSFILKEFQLTDASFHIQNSAKQREFNLTNFTISLHDLLISQQPGKDLFSINHVDLSIGDFMAAFQQGGVKRARFKDFRIGMDSLQLQQSVDTVIFHLDDFTAGLKALDMHTSDSLYHLTLEAFDFSYKNKSIKLENLSFKPNISDAAMQDRFKFQHTQISCVVGSANFLRVNFDSLIYYRSLFIDEIVVDNPALSIFKDNTKPVDKNRFPQYFGQQINAIPIPVRIKQVTVTHVNLVNVERKKDSTNAKVSINRGTVSVKNISNLKKNTFLTLDADAYIIDKVHFNARLDFSYAKPEFTLLGKLEKFNLPDLNPVLLAYTPAKINAGVADEITFSSTVTWTNSSGTMKFLYHDLDVDLDLKDKAKWKSSVIAFAANSIVNASNPGSSELPPRIVQLKATRDMNKGFVNIIIKSVLSGVKETMVASKENRQAYSEAKKKSKREKKAK